MSPAIIRLQELQKRSHNWTRDHTKVWWHRSTAHANTRYPENHLRGPPWCEKIPSQSPFSCALARNHKRHYLICQPGWSLPETPEEQTEPTRACRPWEILSSDLLEYRDHQSLFTYDYYSKFPIIRKLAGTSSLAIINHVKSIFAEHGILSQLIQTMGYSTVAESFASLKKHMV